MRVVFAAAAVFVAAVSMAQDRPWTVYGGTSNSLQFLGGEDERSGFIIGAQTSQPEPRFTFRGRKAEMVWDAYFLRTRGQEIDEHPSEFANALGLIVMARYRFGSQEEWFLDLGLGLQVQDKISVDLDTYTNTTPVVGLGYNFSLQHTDLMAQLRFMHISNGGTNQPNQGQNHVQLLIGARF